MKRIHVLLLVLILGIAVSAPAAEMSFDITDSRAHFTISFSRGYANLSTLKSDKSYVITFETSENVGFDKEFWDAPLSRAYMRTTDSRHQFILEYNGAVIEPTVNGTDRKIDISVDFPPSAAGNATEPVAAPAEETDTGGNVYFRMIYGLLFVLAFILGIFWLLKITFRRTAFTEIPGTGRLLGKVDLDVRKGLYFYELGDTLYILGVTENSISTVDRVTDEEQVTMIKSGFSRKREFSSYMRFFKKSHDLNDDIEMSKAVVEEKLESLKKR